MKREDAGRGRRLDVKKETLRILSDGELVQVNGGGRLNNCTRRISGCIVHMID